MKLICTQVRGSTTDEVLVGGTARLFENLDSVSGGDTGDFENKSTGKHRIYHLESLIYLLSNLCSSQDDLATDEYQEHNLGFYHAIDKPRE